MMSISAARKARPARAVSKFRLRSEKLWLTDRTARKQDRSATPECVLRSPELQNVSGKTLVSASTVEKDFEDYGGNKSAARKVGITLAKRAAEKGITDVVFDRGGYVYHGRVQELAEGAREGGLNF